MEQFRWVGLLAKEWHRTVAFTETREAFSQQLPLQPAFNVHLLLLFPLSSDDLLVHVGRCLCLCFCYNFTTSF